MVDGRGAPEIAVVIPTYQRAEGLRRLLDALDAQSLDASRFEVVLVDDCSGDATRSVADEWASATKLQARVLSTDRNAGPARARNIGWRAAAAPLLAFTDDDCIPEPQWLEAGLAALRWDDRLGVVQGCTLRSTGEPLGYWTVYREVTDESPWFEGCNVFYRRAALEEAGGFDEAARWYWEDTAAGWDVLACGWQRDFAPAAILRHDDEERGVGWHAHQALLERAAVRLAARQPLFRDQVLWRRWAFRPEPVGALLALTGVAVAPRFRPALGLAVPYLWWRRDALRLALRQPRPAATVLARFGIDLLRVVGHLRGSIESGTVVL